MGRKIEALPEHTYMVVDETYSRPFFYGPYSTPGAAKGKRTAEISAGTRYAKNPDDVYIMRSPAGDWERVEL
jgi:hypothetical protein